MVLGALQFMKGSSESFQFSVKKLNHGNKNFIPSEILRPYDVACLAEKKVVDKMFQCNSTCVKDVFEAKPS